MNAPIQCPCPSHSGLVTVVIPAYNRDHLIAETLESIRNQSYQNWELIVVEDASVGETERIVSRFADSVPNSVKYLRNEINRGAAESRNVAFRIARGEFVATLDSDDRWLPNHLKLLVGRLQRSGAGIAYAKVMMFEDQTDKEMGVYGPSDDEVAGFPTTLFNRNFVVPSATVMRRQVLEVVGPWSSRYQFCEDFDYFLRCVSSFVDFSHVDEVTCHYRKCHSGATTEKLAGTLEEVAYTVMRYRRSEAVPADVSRNYAFENLLVAAKLHRRSDPAKDPSADRMRGGQLLIQAWRLKPMRLGVLLQGTAICLREFVYGGVAMRSDRTRFRTTDASPATIAPRYLASHPAVDQRAA
ncbi:UDP-Glc:alpha-D-GlcNAc-diphosphoundecaprenol beta-1,3-glucosyltransferase WfgD [Rubripirellula lacrimiformis]|uniref:UDP-Glc:alpha-D-GlcNAc-diphosphoundecaprenol beta-1,3-glucosyltransferase WfgD n=1 Tax=Rubripirellula lacrimiformis TaxID=1930273 RepID=A0A517NF67_9BACT|nr:glycosyltransferase family 2 protein [Rubripirellula lacrimiformis]QDT05698.1 UDP-Glc:alpha-D-GlcNAc-diphosphoundecaprenol beta-1,3-glucosyltransferase WfgD [Rubripirellula lacrimiformis]